MHNKEFIMVLLVGWMMYNIIEGGMLYVSHFWEFKG